MTLPAIGMIIGGLIGRGSWVWFFGICLYVLMISFYLLTAYFIFGHSKSGETDFVPSGRK